MQNLTTKDLTGQRFGRLMVLEKAETRNHRTYWRCVCDCGNYSDVRSDALISGKTKSCGCLQKESAANLKMKHGKCNTKIYRAWDSMKDRCRNKNCNNYKNYGARGITYCDEWEEFDNFYNWAMENGYSDELTLDRIDVNGNYEPSNCRWATYDEQARNKRTNRIITYNGETKCVKDWAEFLGIDSHLLSARLNRLGWDEEKALTTPVDKRYARYKKQKSIDNPSET